MRVAHVVDCLDDHWYPTHLVESQARAHPDDEFFVYGFDDLGYELDLDNAVSSFDHSWWSYAVVLPYRMYRNDIDVVHVQSEPETFGGLYGNVFLPVFFLLLNLLGFSVVTTIHGPVFGDDIWAQSVERAPSWLSALLLYPYLVLLFNLLVGFSTEVIVHGEVFKRRLGRNYFVSTDDLTVVYHGVATDASK